MVKLVAYYKEPEDKTAFDEKYFNEHIPLVLKMPGLIKAEVWKLQGLGGAAPKFYMQADMYFENEEALNKAMMSDEGKASGKNLMSFAKDYVIMNTGSLAE